jgi:hypothetical protein
MSYWFGDPHTLVLARVPTDLRYPRKHGRLRVKIGNCFRRVRYSAHAFGVKTEIFSGFNPITGQVVQ